LIFQVVRTDQFLDCFAEQVWIVPVVVPPFQFIQVGVQMLLADLMIGTHNRPLEQTPDAFNGVCMHLAAYPFLLGMVDGQMLRIMIANALVRYPFVRHDLFGVSGCELLNEALKLLSGRVRNNAHPHVTATLNNASNNGFIGKIVPAPAPTDFLPTNEGFIDFDGSIEKFRTGFRHSRTDTMAEIPRGLIGHANSSLDLIRRYAFLRFRHHVDRQKPLPERQMAVMEDRACRHGEMVVAGLAIILIAAFNPVDLLLGTAWTLDAFLSAEPFQVGAALVLVAEAFN